MTKMAPIVEDDAMSRQFSDDMRRGEGEVRGRVLAKAAAPLAVRAVAG